MPLWYLDIFHIWKSRHTVQSANCLKMQNLFAIFYANGKITFIIHHIVQAVRISSVNCRNSGVLYMAPLLYEDKWGFYLEFCTKDKNSQLVQGVVGPRWSLSVTRFNNIAILERFDSADNTVFPIQYKNMYTMPQWYYHCSDTFGNISFVHPSCAQTLQWLS